MKAICSLAFLGALVVPTVVSSTGEILEQVLVKVNGDIITKTELEQRQVAALRERLNKQVNPKALNDDELKAALAEITPQLLVNAIDELLLVQMGKEKGYKLSNDQWNEWLLKMRKEQNLEDEARFQSALKQEGMTLEELRKTIERNFMISQVQREEVGQKLSITQEEARQYYLAHRDEFAEAATVTLREILIEVPTSTQGGQVGVNVGKEDEIKEKADAIRTRVAAGEDFGKVAAEVSAAASKANGGLIGPINAAELSPQLTDLLAKMKPGEVTQPIRTPRGFQILKLESAKAASIPPFESVADLASDKTHDARQRTEVRRFLARVRGQALIEWKNDELKKAYERALAAPEATGI